MRGKVEKVDRGERTYEDVLSSLETEQLMVADNERRAGS